VSDTVPGSDVRSADAAPREQPSRPWLVAAVAAVGVLIGANLLLARVTGGEALFCVARSDCGAVHASRYAMFLGAPTAAWGVGLYAVIGGLALGGLPARRWLAAFQLSVVGLATSTYLAYLAVRVLGAACVYCLLSAAIAATLSAALLAWRPPVAPHRSLLRAGPLMALTTVTAFATVLIAAAGFALGSSP